MTLKSSLWKTEKSRGCRSSPALFIQMKENAKRRLWLFALLSFVQMLCYPLMTALTLGRYGREEVSLVVWQGGCHDILGIRGGPTVFLVTTGAVLCAAEGFSWIYSRMKTDMYLAQPITACRRFLMTYINGILIYFIPYIVSLCIALLVTAGAGAASSALFVDVLFTLVSAFIYFLAVYHVTLIAMMISGRRGMAGFFVLMGFLYEAILRATLESYASAYFSTYVSRDTTERFITPVFRMIESLGKSTFSWEAGKAVPGDILEHLVIPMLPDIMILLVEAVLFGVIAYYCYKKRPAEAISQAVAFPSVKGPVKVLLMFVSGLLGCACFCDVSGYDGFFVAVPGLVLGIGFCQVLMEIVYEGDMRAFTGHKRSFAAGAAAAVAGYLFFALDISGYDTWIPAPEQVESAAIEIGFGNNYRFEHVDEEDAITWNEQYGLETMKLTDVSGVLSLAKDGMGKDAREQNPDTRLNCSVKYRLKSGKEKYRDFCIDYEQEKTVLDILFANEEYKEGSNQVLLPRMDRIFEKSRIYYDNGMQETEIADKNGIALMRAYQEDLRKMSFTDIKEAVPCGVLRLRYKTGRLQEYTLEYPVFPTYTRTIEYLREKNIELYLAISPKAVESLLVSCYQEREDAEVIDHGGFFGTFVNTMELADLMEKEYGKREQIEELLGYLYPGSLVSWCYTMNSFDHNISVRAEASDDLSAYLYHWGDTDFMVRKGKLPEFVKKDFGLSGETDGQE